VTTGDEGGRGPTAGSPRGAASSVFGRLPACACRRDVNAISAALRGGARLSVYAGRDRDPAGSIIAFVRWRLPVQLSIVSAAELERALVRTFAASPLCCGAMILSFTSFATAAIPLLIASMAALGVARTRSRPRPRRFPFPPVPLPDDGSIDLIRDRAVLSVRPDIAGTTDTASCVGPHGQRHAGRVMVMLATFKGLIGIWTPRPRRSGRGRLRNLLAIVNRSARPSGLAVASLTGFLQSSRIEVALFIGAEIKTTLPQQCGTGFSFSQPDIDAGRHSSFSVVIAMFGPPINRVVQALLLRFPPTFQIVESRQSTCSFVPIKRIKRVRPEREFLFVGMATAS